jgi:hypothetical protein
MERGCGVGVAVGVGVSVVVGVAVTEGEAVGVAVRVGVGVGRGGGLEVAVSVGSWMAKRAGVGMAGTPPHAANTHIPNRRESPKAMLRFTHSFLQSRGL